MITYPEAAKIQDIITAARRIVIIQADNPDADSLGSALALEQIIGDMKKEPLLYCGVDIPTYLRYMAGWDRVQKDLPKQFDASIVVDASTPTLLEHLQNHGEMAWLAAKPCVVLDHHAVVEKTLPFASVVINDPAQSSAGELIFTVAEQLGLSMNSAAQECIMAAILGDTQGLTNQLANASTYRVMATLIERGASRVRLEELRREFGKMPPEIFRYKADLIQRTAFTAEGKVAYLTIPQNEITAYSPLYNPAPLIQGDMLQTAGVAVAIVFKEYDDGHLTAAIRSNNGYPVAADLARTMGGGGHAYASGFKVTDGRPFNAIKSECLASATELLAKLEEGNSDEALQHTDQTS